MTTPMSDPTQYETDGDTLRAQFEITPQLKWLEGHFPLKALLPGVVQIRWVVRLASLWCGPLTLSEIVSTKFVDPVVPGDTVSITLNRTDRPDGSLVVAFTYETGRGVAAKGKLRLCR